MSHFINRSRTGNLLFDVASLSCLRSGGWKTGSTLFASDADVAAVDEISDVSLCTGQPLVRTLPRTV